MVCQQSYSRVFLGIWIESDLALLTFMDANSLTAKASLAN